MYIVTIIRVGCGLYSVSRCFDMFKFCLVECRLWCAKQTTFLQNGDGTYTLPLSSSYDFLCNSSLFCPVAYFHSLPQLWFTYDWSLAERDKKREMCNYCMACSRAPDVPKQQRSGSKKKLGINYFSVLYSTSVKVNQWAKASEGGGWGFAVLAYCVDCYMALVGRSWQKNTMSVLGSRTHGMFPLLRTVY